MHLAEFPQPLGRDAWREGFEPGHHLTIAVAPEAVSEALLRLEP